MIFSYVRRKIVCFRIVHDVEGMKLAPPQKTATPYGGRLSWRLPGGNLLVVHLKDKLKVSKKKRWSMVSVLDKFDVHFMINLNFV